jgi:hypothetical protein
VICEKCGGKVNNNGRCSLCGYDNSNVHIPENYEAKPKSFRSVRVTVFMYLVIALDAIVATILLFNLFRNSGLSTGDIAVSVVSILLCVFEIIVAFFILRLKKWALITYIFLSVIGGIIQLLRLDFISIIFKALLLYFIFRNDWEYFE